MVLRISTMSRIVLGEKKFKAPKRTNGPKEQKKEKGEVKQKKRESVIDHKMTTEWFFGHVKKWGYTRE